MNLKNTLLRRLHLPRPFSLVGLMALVIVVAALAMIQTPTVAAPPPPLRGPFHFVELPRQKAAAATSGTIAWTPLYTQTFADSSVYTDSNWTISTTIGMSTVTWGRVLDAGSYPSANFTNTLWTAAYPGPGLPVDYTVHAGDTYTRNMDAWAIYGPLDTQQYGRFRATFSFYLDADPGASFSWAASTDGTNFCGQSLSGHIRQWITITSDLLNCPGQTGTPAYLAFRFQSDTSTPSGLGAFVDNLVISGQLLSKVYMPLVRRDPTPTPTPTPTFTGVRYYDFEPGTSTTGDWCSRDTTDFTSAIKSLGGSNSYYLRVKQTNWMVMQSPRVDPPSNYRITAKFNLLGMDNSLNLADYGSAQFGLIFGVWGAAAFPPPPNSDSHCAWSQGAEDGGYYQFIIQIKSDGSGYTTRLERHEKQTTQQVINGSDVTLSRTDWNNTLQLDRNGSGIVMYVNGVQVLSWSDSTKTGAAWWGVFTETKGKNKDGKFESNWDNIQIFNLGS